MEDASRRPVRCAIYTRQSSKRRTTGSPFSSSDAQRDACQAFIASHAEEGWVAVDETFDDQGSSGQTLERPGLFKLFFHVHQRQVDCIVVHRLDRLTRSLLDWTAIEQYLELAKIKLVVVCGNLQFDGSPLSKLRFNTLAIAAEFEREMIVERVSDAHARHHAQGRRSAGRIPFGYRSSPQTKQLEINPVEASVVKQAFELASRGLKPNEIANSLNRIRVSPAHRSHQTWIPRTVLRLLRNRSYLGLMPDGSPSVHAPIISEGLFQAVQQSLDQRRTRPTAPRPSKGDDDPFLLRGLLVCAECGRTMTTTSSRAVRPKGPFSEKHQPGLYYRCRSDKPCSHVSTELVETELLKTLKGPPSHYSAPLREMLIGMAFYWDYCAHAYRRKMLTAYLDRIIWYQNTNKLEPVPAADLAL